MDLVFWLLVISVIEGGVIAGVSFDVALVKLPTRKRIGPVAYAQFARGNDLGNGKIVYPILGISAVVLVFGALIAAWLMNKNTQVMLPLSLAAIFTALHSLCTGKAAPIMLSLAKTPDEPELLNDKLNRFAFWHWFRMALQLAAFVVLVWALVGASSN